jgi:hypothetical protein
LLPAKQEVETAITTCSTVKQALSAPTIAMAILGGMSEEELLVRLTAEISRCMELYFDETQRLSPDQCGVVAEMMLDEYKHESLGDIRVFLKKATMGKYDEGKTYGRLTSMKLMPWFGQYLEEKAIEREKQMLKDKQNAAIPMLSDRALEAFKQQNGMSTEQWMMVARLERAAKKMTDDQLRAEYVRQKKNGNEAAVKLVLRVAEERGITKQQQR